MKNNVVILSDKIKINKRSKEHEKDTFQQVQQINTALKNLGYFPINLEFNLDLNKLGDKIKKIKPLFVFNLVEEEDFIILAPLLLENLNIRYTGCSAVTIHQTNNKIIFKNFFDKHISAIKNFRIPEYINETNISGFKKNKKYIIKAEKYHSSLGISEDSVRNFGSVDDILKKIAAKKEEMNVNFFAEEFIEGREFNVAIINGEVLPIAEMRYINYPKGKPKIICYKAKWEENAFEYSNTVRSFDFEPKDKKLVSDLKNISIAISNLFNKLPYARIDYIVDKNNTPFVLEVNANPCLNMEAGFFAICQKLGLDFEDMIKKIISVLN